MTSISGVPPVPSALPIAENKPRAATDGAQFHVQLLAQSRPRLQQPETTNAQVLSDSTTNGSHHPEVEAMIQAMEWRRHAAIAPGKPGRSVPGTRASGLDIADFSFPDRDALAVSEVVKQRCANEEGRPMFLKPVDDPIVCTPADDESELSSEFICEGGLNAFAIAVALSGTTLIWLPIEIVRAPLRSPEIRIWRRRKPESACSHFFSQSDSEGVAEKSVF